MSVEEPCVSDVLNRIKYLPRRMPNPLRCPPELQHSGFSIWKWQTSYANSSGQSALETGHCIYKPSRTCFPTWQPRATICTPNSARVYLQQMTDLKAEHPDVPQRFDDGIHAIRRSDRQWAGLSSDRIMEQVMMRSVKRWANTRARHDGATAPGVVAIDACMCRNQPGNA